MCVGAVVTVRSVALARSLRLESRSTRNGHTASSSTAGKFRSVCEQVPFKNKCLQKGLLPPTLYSNGPTFAGLVPEAHLLVRSISGLSSRGASHQPLKVR